MTTGQPDELISIGEAASVLGTGEEQVETMIQEGMLSPVGAGADTRLRRAEVQAAAELGG